MTDIVLGLSCQKFYSSKSGCGRDQYPTTIGRASLRSLNPSPRMIDHYLRAEIDSVTIVQDGDLAWWKFANVYSQATFAAWLGQRQAQGIEPKQQRVEREKIMLETTEYTIRSRVDASAWDAACMPYEEWREIQGEESIEAKQTY